MTKSFLLVNTSFGLLAWIGWFISISKSQRILCVLFSKTDSGLSAWQNFSLLHNYHYYYSGIFQFQETMNLHLALSTSLSKIVWKTGSCLCSRSPLFHDTNIVQRKGRVLHNLAPVLSHKLLEIKLPYRLQSWFWIWSFSFS